MTLKEFHKQARKDPAFRKAEYNGQWDTPFDSSRVVSEIRMKGLGLTQKELAKKAKVLQSAISRAENEGCQLSFLNKLAKAVGYKLEIKVVKANKLC